MSAERFRTLYCDPGESFGWCLGRGAQLLAAGTEDMFTFADEVWEALQDPDGPSILNGDTVFLRNGVTAEDNAGPIRRIVCEDFRLYPWKIKEMAWDSVRTARVIGALKMMCRIHGIEFVLQPASIKETAQAAGAEELYYRPLHENRHQNDAIQHFVFFTNTALRGIRLHAPDEEARDDEG